jgi:hypothetical protein
MNHGGTGGSDQVGEPGPRDDQHQRGEPDAGRGGAGTGELGDARGAELERRREVSSQRDAQSPEVEVVLPPDQPVGPGSINVELRVVSLSRRDDGLPTAAELAEYNRVMPGLAREIVDQAHANMASDRKINELQVQTAATLDKWGLAIAGGISGTGIGCAMLCLFLLHPAGLAVSGAGIFGLAAAAPVINAFLQRRGSKGAGDDKPAPTSPPDDV